MKVVLKLLIIAVLAVLIAGGILLFTPLGDEALNGIFPVRESEPVDFATLQLTGNPNQYLLCPPGLCGEQAHADSAVYEIPADELRARWEAVVLGQPRVTVLKRDRTNFQVDYVQRSAWFRFPDIVSVRFIPLTSDSSTIAVYSRSVFGKSDFGINRKRIEAWMAALEEGE